MNLNKDEREALRGLTKDENVVIVPADKGRCLVVANREDYDQKCKSLLDDKKTYKPLGYNPTNGFRKKVCAFTNKIYTEGTIKVHFKRKLDPPSEPTVPAFYGLPKIHKPEPHSTPADSQQHWFGYVQLSEAFCLHPSSVGRLFFASP